MTGLIPPHSVSKHVLTPVPPKHYPFIQSVQCLTVCLVRFFILVSSILQKDRGCSEHLRAFSYFIQFPCRSSFLLGKANKGVTDFLLFFSPVKFILAIQVVQLVQSSRSKGFVLRLPTFLVQAIEEFIGTNV